MNLKMKFFLALVCLAVCFIITGCKNSQIKFVTESKFQKVMNNVVNNNSERDKVYKSKGVVIYKTEDNKGYGSSTVNFGPKDPTFNMPLKF